MLDWTWNGRTVHAVGTTLSMFLPLRDLKICLGPLNLRQFVSIRPSAVNWSHLHCKIQKTYERVGPFHSRFQITIILENLSKKLPRRNTRQKQHGKCQLSWSSAGLHTCVEYMWWCSHPERLLFSVCWACFWTNSLRRYSIQKLHYFELLFIISRTMRNNTNDPEMD